MKNIVYISLNGIDHPEIFAIATYTRSFGWSGKLEVVEKPYFRVVGIVDGKPNLHPLPENSPETRRIDGLLIDSQIPKNMTRILEPDVQRYLPSCQEEPAAHL